MSTSTRPQPSAALNALYRAPAWLYRWRLGWLAGHRFLLLTYRGAGRAGRSRPCRRSSGTTGRRASTVVSGYGPTAVRVHWRSRAYGTFESPRDSGSVGHTADLDLRGIEMGQDTLTFDGVCRDTLQNRFRSLDGQRQRYFLWISSTVVDAVRFLKSTIQTSGATDSVRPSLRSAKLRRSPSPRPASTPGPGSIRDHTPSN